MIICEWRIHKHWNGCDGGKRVTMESHFIHRLEATEFEKH